MLSRDSPPDLQTLSQYLWRKSRTGLDVHAMQRPWLQGALFLVLFLSSVLAGSSAPALIPLNY